MNTSLLFLVTEFIIDLVRCMRYVNPIVGMSLDDYDDMMEKRDET